jgi:hypothetical protein
MSELRRREPTVSIQVSPEVMRALCTPESVKTLERAAAAEYLRRFDESIVDPGRAKRRRFERERAQIAVVLIASRQRRQRRLSVALWLAVVLFSVVALVVTYHRCFGH